MLGKLRVGGVTMALGSGFSFVATARIVGIALLGVIVGFAGAVVAVRQVLVEQRAVPMRQSTTASIREQIAVDFPGPPSRSRRSPRRSSACWQRSR